MPKLAFAKFLLIVAALPLVAGAVARVSSAQERVLPPILPDRFGGWVAERPADDIDFGGPANFQDLQKEAGRSAGDQCNYVSGAKRIHVHADKYRDPSSAYEIYTALLTADMLPSTVGELSGVTKNHLLMLLGNIVLEVADHQSASTADLQQLARMVKSRADQAPLPPIRVYLPQGLSDGTQRYALGPAGFQQALRALRRSEHTKLTPEIGFANGAEVMLAEYRRKNDSGVVLLIEYPTPQLAEQHMRHLQTILPEGADGGAKIERTGSLLSLVLGATSPAYAQTLRGAINYETQVTWNEGSHVVTDPPWVVVLSRIFFATGIFLVVAIVLGVAFGGVRILTKRFFPGKVFDRPQDIEVLQLGLSGKRVDSDFH